MFDHLKSNWRTLRQSPAGSRFIKYHAARQSNARHPWKRPLMLILGICVVLAGLVLLPAPGPGTLIVVAGACVLAGESKKVATGLDRAELAIRRLWRRLRNQPA